VRRHRNARPPALTALVGVVLALGGLAACGDDDDDATAGDTAVATGDGSADPSTSTAGATSADVPATADDTTASTGDDTATTVPLPCEPELSDDAVDGTPEGDVALQTDLVVDQTACQATVTFTFTEPESATPGSVVPGFSVERADPPFVQDGSGEPVEVDGDAFVFVRLEPASVVDLSVDPYVETYTGPDELRPTTDGPVVEVQLLGSFEAVTTWVIGTQAGFGFNAELLADPPRLVVTVA
jgi:hypothetical protein